MSSSDYRLMSTNDDGGSSDGDDRRPIPLRILGWFVPHPFRSYMHHHYALKMVPMTAWSLLVLVIVLVLDSQLKNDVASGYSSLEYAGSESQANKVLDSWAASDNGTGKQSRIAAFSSGFHFLFLFCYSFTLTLFVTWAAEQIPINSEKETFKCGILQMVSWLGDFLAWIQPLAALFDVLLQSILIGELTNGVQSGGPEFAMFCAITHTIIIGLGFFYFLIVGIIMGCIVWRIMRIKKERTKKMYGEES